VEHQCYLWKGKHARLHIDYMNINKSTMKNWYPFPNIDDLFNQLRQATIFSKIDLRLGYHQVRIKWEYIHKSTFRTRYGHYEFVVVPLGLTNSPITFMCLMNNALSNYLDKLLLIFIGDILVYFKNKEEHEKHLTMMLQLQREHNIHARLSKCEFFQSHIEDLRHIVSKEGVPVDLENIKAIMEWHAP